MWWKDTKAGVRTWPFGPRFPLHDIFSNRSDFCCWKGYWKGRLETCAMKEEEDILMKHGSKDVVKLFKPMGLCLLYTKVIGLSWLIHNSFIRSLHLSCQAVLEAPLCQETSDHWGKLKFIPSKHQHPNTFMKPALCWFRAWFQARGNQRKHLIDYDGQGLIA